MAKKKISELPAGGALNGTELVPIVQTGTTKRITAQDIANLGNASGVEGSGTINYLAKFTATSTIGNSLLFDNGTSIGLGTATPSATYKLDIIGGLRATTIVKSGGTSAEYLKADGSVSTLTNPITGTGTTNYLPKFTGASALGDSQIFDNGTNVGIGTASPSEALEIYKAGGGTAQFKIGDASVSKGYMGVFSNSYYITAGGTYDGSWVLDGANGVANIVLETSNGGSAIAFATANSNTNGTERMRILSDGNVGIGTASPASKLNVLGAGTTAISISNSNAGTNPTPELTQLNFLGFQQENRARIEAIDVAGSANGSQLRFYNANTSNTLAENMRIASSGNVLIGTTTDAGYKLDVLGNSKFSGNSYGENGISSFGSNAGNGVYAVAGGSAGSGVYGYTADVSSFGGTFENTAGGFGLRVLGKASVSGRLTMSTGGYILTGNDMVWGDIAGDYIGQYYSGTSLIFYNGTGGSSLFSIARTTGAATFSGEVSAVTRFRLNPSTQTNQIIGDGTASNLAGANNLLLRNDSGSIFFASGSANVQMLLNTSGNLLINTSTDVASSKLTIDSTTQGVLVPRMTTTQINAIGSPANGLIAYNTTLAVLCFYDGTGWKRVVHLAM